MRLSDKLLDIRVTGVGINGSGYVEDAYIYRLDNNSIDNY
jgi:hypothetical protein